MPVVEKRLVPYGDVETPGGSGGPTIPFRADGALKVGDVVVFSAAADDVAVSATAADAIKVAGIVVGGGNSFGGAYSLEDSGSTGLALVADNKIAQVRVAGIAYVKAGAAITLHDTVGLDTGTAGRVISNSTSKQIIGIALDAALNDGDKIRVLLQPK